MTGHRSVTRDTLGRPIRTGTQGGVVYGIMELLSAFDLAHFTPRQYGAVVVFGTATVGWIQVMLENRFGWAFLRPVPHPVRRRVHRRRAKTPG